ncbi:MAG TPA: hypothetical protein VFO60_05940 [Candidatus Dormibacteraeota bacterium]|nr:hypothetical protein [Candidatus Dormibacteraeota bacterium]
MSVPPGAVRGRAGAGDLRAKVRAIVIMTVAWATFLSAGAYLLFTALNAHLGQSPCGTDSPCPTDTGRTVAYVTVGLSLVTFWLGHRVTRWRLVDPYRRAGTPSFLTPARERRMIHIALATFFGIGVLLLVYEAIGSANVNGLQPITNYVRYARIAHPYIAAVFAMSVAFVIGHWYWPDEPNERDEPSGRGGD